MPYTTDAYSNMQSPFPVVPVKQFQKRLLFCFCTQNYIPHSFGSNVMVTLLQFTVNPVNRLFSVINKSINVDGFHRSPHRLAGFYISILWVYIAFHTETHLLTINGYPAKKRNQTVCFLFVSFQEKENFKCTSHTKILILKNCKITTSIPN
jgi:hypothetical protein